MMPDAGPWVAFLDKSREWSKQCGLQSDDFTYDACLYVTGDFESDEAKLAYAQAIARALNDATNTARTGPGL
jgi:hypothetical protein